MVTARSLSHVYPSGRGSLVDVDLGLEAGERVVVLGPNGSGKSTLVQLLAGLLEPRRGLASVLGVEAARAPRGVRRRIGVALDQPAHWEALTGRENALLLARAAGLDGARADAAVRELLERFGLEGDVPVGEYSLGMKRRLLLVETLAHRPEVILLDEPTLGLDPPAVEVLAVELEQRAAKGAAVLAATNDVRAAPLVGSRAVFLLGGRKVADEPMDALLARLRTRTRLEIALGAGGSPGDGLLGRDDRPGALTLRLEGDVLVADSSEGAEPLPDLLRWLLDRGAHVKDVRVREPDLADAFRELTGSPLWNGPDT